jgi:hypothetical protein
MTDPIGTPKAPVGGDFSRATYEQVLFAVTGYGPDLHGVLDTGETPGKGWFVQGSTPAPGGKQEDGTSGGTGYSYHAWDKWYIAVNRDANQPGYWDKAVDDITDLADSVNVGKLGLMDVNKLWDAKAAVDQYVAWLAANHTTLQQWVNKLTSDDSAFKGKAAHAIQQNLKRLAFTINDLHEQIVTDHGTPESLRATAEALATFARGMANVWWEHSGSMKFLVNNTMAAVVNNVHAYIVGKGLAHGTPNYVLDILASDSRERAEAYIKQVVTGYSSDANTGPLFTSTPNWTYYPGNYYASGSWSVNYSIGETGSYPFTPGPLPEGFPRLSGPLDSQSTWDAFNVAISEYARKKLEPLDTKARTLLSELQTAYDRTKKPLDELDTPTPPMSGGGPGSNPYGNFPPPGGGGNPYGNFPPPGGGDNNPYGNFPPPGGGTGNVPPPGGGGGNVPPPGGAGNVPPPGGGGNVPPPGGGDGNQPPINSKAFDPPGGGGNVPPPNGGGNGNVPILPPGALPPPLSNGAPNSRTGNRVDADGNPINPPGGDPNLLPPPTNNLPGADLPVGSSEFPGDLPGSVSNQPPGSGNFPGDFGNLPGGNGNLPGDFGNLPGGTSTLPDFSNLPGGNSNLPGGNLPGGSSNLPGDFGNLPGGNSNLPGGFGNLPGGNGNLPGDFGNLPGGNSNLPGGGGGAGGLPGGSGNLPGDFGNMPGGGGAGGLPGGANAPGGGFGNSPGAGGFGGEGWADWSGQGPTANSDGSPFAASNGGQPGGGMPMMPPMMPPMGGNQGDSKERERQTWLSEDDKVWGTDNTAGNGVIGLPNDVLFETDEPLAPTHVHVSSTSLRGTQAEAPEQKKTEQAAEQTATS